MTSSLFNQNVQSWSVNGNSSTFANDIVTKAAGYGVGNVPIYYVPAGTPDSSLSVASGCGNFTSSTGTQIPVPSYVSLNGTSDNPMVLYQPSANEEWELWELSKTSSGYQACWGGAEAISSSDGVFPSPYGESATGISYMATEVTEADIASGSINHAIAITVPSCNGYIYPADRGDCGSAAGQPAEGQWFRLPASLAMPSGLTPFAQMVFRALQNYGAVVADQAGGYVLIQTEQPSDWSEEGHSGTDPITASMNGQAGYSVVASLPWGSLQTVNCP